MKKNILLVFVLLFGLFSCKEPKIDQPVVEIEHALFMYMPWSTNLTGFFQQNITDFEKALNISLLRNNKLIVFLSSSTLEASMFEFKYEKNAIVRTTLKTYKFDNPVYTTAAGITSILNDVKGFASAKHYSMIVSGHGMGWLPVGTGLRMLREDYEKYHWEYEGVPSTRFFGGATSDVQTEITTLAKGITDAEIKMDYILFDNCYMSTIETAYDLRKVTNYIIASPTEIMDYGFPYHIIGKFLLGNVDLQGVCEGFYNFYLNYTYPYGTIAVTATAELDNLAAVMKYINQKFSFDISLLSKVQRMDGYSPVIFFDMGDYVSKLCTDVDLLALFNYHFERVVPLKWRQYTQSYYSASMGTVAIHSFSGITISDPSINSKAINTKLETAWYKATH